MTLASVRRTLVGRLDEDLRSDRGWWVLTRVHVSAHWLKAIAEYLENRAGDSVFSLDALDYRRLGTIIESHTSDPGQQLRRHHLLVMDMPLQLLARTRGNHWNSLVLTNRGRELAHADDIGSVLEEALVDIRFARSPWSPPDRIVKYPSFDVPVYSVTKQVLRRTDGYIDRNEFDFFLSRIRTRDEIDWAVDAINFYRELEPADRELLHDEVRNRLPNAKAYSNWRDMGLHTFSLFSLGTSMVRSDQRLLLTERWVRTQTQTRERRGSRTRASRQTQPSLRIPNPPEVDDLLVPPAAPASNDGSDAESFVAKILRSQGWQVAFYTNRRGYGFDLWARKDGRAMLVEVKSSIGQHGAVILTRSEYEAASTYAANFVLAIVEDMGSGSPRLTMLQNPVNTTKVTEQSSIGYRIPRREWVNAKKTIEEH